MDHTSFIHHLYVPKLTGKGITCRLKFNFYNPQNKEIISFLSMTKTLGHSNCWEWEWIANKRLIDTVFLWQSRSPGKSKCSMPCLVGNYASMTTTLCKKNQTYPVSDRKTIKADDLQGYRRLEKFWFLALKVYTRLLLLCWLSSKCLFTPKVCCVDWVIKIEKLGSQV